MDGEAKPEVTAQHVINILTQSERCPVRDFEFVQHCGVLHVSRFAHDKGLNKTFRQRQGDSSLQMTVRDSKNSRLDILRNGQFDTLVFRQDDNDIPLDADDVEVEAMLVGLNAKVSLSDLDASVVCSVIN